MFRIARLSWSVVVSFLLPCLTHGQEVKFLPDKPLNFGSVDFVALMKSQAYADLQKEFPPLKAALENKFFEQLGIPVANIARISIGVAYADQGEEIVGFVRTLAPVKWADLKAARKSGPYRVNLHYDELKVGDYVAYQEKYQFQFAPEEKPGEVRTGELICVVEDKLVLYGESPTNLKRILERNKAPDLGAMEKAMKLVDLENASFMLVNLKDLPDSRKDRMKRNLPFPGAEDVLKAAEAIVLQAKLGAKLEAKAIALGKDDESAVSIKKSAETALAGFRGILGALKADERTPAEMRKIVQDGDALLGSVTLSTKGNQAIAEVSADPAVIVKMIIAAVTLEKGDSKPAK